MNLSPNHTVAHHPLRPASPPPTTLRNITVPPGPASPGGSGSDGWYNPNAMGSGAPMSPNSDLRMGGMGGAQMGGMGVGAAGGSSGGGGMDMGGMGVGAGTAFVQEPSSFGRCVSLSTPPTHHAYTQFGPRDLPPQHPCQPRVFATAIVSPQHPCFGHPVAGLIR